MKTCPYCHYKSSIHMKFCSECGREIPAHPPYLPTLLGLITGLECALIALLGQLAAKLFFQNSFNTFILLITGFCLWSLLFIWLYKKIAFKITRIIVIVISAIFVFMIIDVCLLLSWKSKSVPSVSVVTKTRYIDNMTEVYIPGNQFHMGASPADTAAYGDETPQHLVYVDAFWIDIHEVTISQYALCVNAKACTEPKFPTVEGKNVYYGSSRASALPVIYVDWKQAQEYCNWVGASLPKEAQWELAARDLDGRIYPWGDYAPTAGLANYNKNVGAPLPVCSFPQGDSPYGLCDMAGNVAEWVNDLYSEDYYQSSPARNPTGLTKGIGHVIRGGSWYDTAANIRVTFRLFHNSSDVFPVLGFRCARKD
jgi:formylglycine-generating enzyme required for sulfatase activity